MDTNELEVEPTPIDPVAVWEEADVPRPSLLRASWHGAKVAFRWVSYIVGPFAGVLLILSLIPTAVGLGARRGFGVTAMALESFSLYFVCVFGGVILGALLGMVGYVIGWFGRGTGTERTSWWSIMTRPIHPSRSQPVTVTSTDRVAGGVLRRCWPFLLGVPVQFLMMGAFGTGVYVGWDVDRRLADAIAAADGDDRNWRLDDLKSHREPVPDQENSALILDRALSLMPPDWPADPAPPPGTPRPPESDASRAFEALTKSPDNQRLDGTAASVLQDELEKYREAVEIARTVMDYDRGRRELERTRKLIDTPLWATQMARDVGRLLAADAAIRVESGDSDGALDSCRAFLNTARSIGDEPFLISQLVRISIGSSALKSVRRVLGQGEPSDAAMARLQTLILDEMEQPIALHGMRAERADLTELFRRLGSGEILPSELNLTRPPIDAPGVGTTVPPWSKLSFDHQQSLALDWTNQAVAIVRRPTAERAALWDAWEADRERVRRLWHSPFTAFFVVTVTHILPLESREFSRYESELGATALLLAAERHRHKNRAWPASIADIDQNVLPRSVVDPFTGQPFCIEHRDGQLFIYSIGPNRKDEHGAYNPRYWDKSRLDDVGAIGWDVDRRGQPASPKGTKPGDDRPGR